MGIVTNKQKLENLCIDNKKISGIADEGKIIYSSGVKIVSFANGTDEEIAAMLEAHYSGDININEYGSVGDIRKIHLNRVASPNTDGYIAVGPEQDITIVITALNHHPLKEKIGIRDKAAVTIQTRECLNNLTKGYSEEGTVYVDLYSNGDTPFAPGSKLPLRTWLNGTFLTTCFSSEWQNLIKETKHNRLITNGSLSSTTEEVVDKIFLPSYPEIYGNTAGAYYLFGITPVSEEGIQGDYYKTSDNRIKYGNNNGSANKAACWGWIGSPSSSYSSRNGYRGCYISNSGDVTSDYGNLASGLAPAFCL